MALLRHSDVGTSCATFLLGIRPSSMAIGQLHSQNIRFERMINGCQIGNIKQIKFPKFIKTLSNILTTYVIVFMYLCIRFNFDIVIYSMVGQKG